MWYDVMRYADFVEFFLEGEDKKGLWCKFYIEDECAVDGVENFTNEVEGRSLNREVETKTGTVIDSESALILIWSEKWKWILGGSCEYLDHALMSEMISWHLNEMRWS